MSIDYLRGVDAWPAGLLEQWHANGGVLRYRDVNDCAALAGGQGNAWMDHVGGGLPVQPLALFDAVLALEAIDEDAPAQMARVGLAGLGAWPRSFSRSRAENLQRAAHMPALRSAGGRPSCDVPPTAEQLGRLVAASAWDAVLHDFARVLARRRTHAYREGE